MSRDGAMKNEDVCDERMKTFVVPPSGGRLRSSSLAA
jgi:hypothetical protein